VVVKLSRPRLAGKELTYDIKVIEGKVPQKGRVCSVYIDIIGLPLTPLSYAGVARRSVYRQMVGKLARGNSRSNRKMKKGIIEMQSFKKSSISRKMLAVGILILLTGASCLADAGRCCRECR
jgi:hypothetical protein